MEVLNKLKESNKGQLNYERKTDFGRLSDDLKNCTSPPLRTFSGVFHSDFIVEEKGDSSNESQDISFNDKLLLSNESDENDEKVVPLCPTEYVHSKLAVLEYEAIYDNKITLALKKKCQEFEENEKNLNMKTSLELEALYEQEAMRDACRYEELKAQQKQLVEEGEKYQKELREQHIHHNETAISKFQEAKLKRKQLEEDAKKDREMKLEQLREQQKKILLSCKTFSHMRSQCEHMEYLSDKINKPLECVTKLNQMSMAILNQAESTGGATNEHLNETISIAEQLDSINAKMKQIVEEANKKVKEQQQQKQQQIAAQQQQQQQQNNVPQNPPTFDESVASPATNTKKQEQDNEENKALKRFSQFIDPEALKEYLRLQAKLKEVETHLDAFLNNVQLKEYRFKIRKAANILINAISPLSGSHLKDKLNKLTLLLQGQNIEVSNKYISAKDHPEGIMFAKYLVAKMLVKKGAEQVSSSHESAYAIATVVVGLWVNFPDLGDLLLANFHLACPYIVPYYIPQEDDQSTEEHQKMLGYKYENGKIEGQEKFLTRMTGIMRLYAAIMVSPLPPGINKPHPHGVENCWSWMTRTINSEPRPDITAAVIYNLLEVTSHALFTNYRKPFQKFLHILITEFLPKIKAVSPSVGSVSRLETFLEAKVKNMGQISKPAGLLTHSFWFT